jgi:catechol 2,3-dioxygenase-like lactoylglutathione lyase family enzyme
MGPASRPERWWICGVAADSRIYTLLLCILTTGRWRYSVARPIKLSHYVLQSQNPHRLASWYAALLDADIVFKTDFLTLLTYDEEHHRIAFAALPPAANGQIAKRENGQPGLSHVAFGFETLGELLTCFEDAKERGDAPVVSIHHGPTISLYYKDPDGNNVETFIEVLPTAKAAMDYLFSPAFQQNPVGVPFDAHAALAKLKSGVPIADIMAFDHTNKVDVPTLGRQTMEALG